MTKTALIGSFFDILSMFGILNFGSAFGGLFVCYLLFGIWNFWSLQLSAAS